MSKFKAALLGAVCAFAGSSAGAAVLGPDAQQCVSGSGPAILVHVVGIKDKSGTVRARAFGGNPSTWFNKKTWLRRTVVPTPGAGTADICLAVPKPGTYAVDIRHDVNDNSDTDLVDGGGASGNPEVSLFDVIFGHKPPAAKTSFQVGEGVTRVTVVVKYKSGASFKPIEQIQTVRR